MYFQNITTIEELKKSYRKLAFKYHPDKGGDEMTMKAINSEYESIFKKLNVTTAGESKYEMNDGFREIINKIINLAELEIEICNLWVWVSGNTKTYRKELKEAGFFWASKKKIWYWRPEEAKIRRSSGMSMDYIRNMYGSETVKSGNEKKDQKNRITA